MKNYTQYIPITALATAIALGGSVNAQETTPEASRKMDQQVESKLPTRSGEKNASRRTSQQENALQMKASDILGMNINTATNENIGEIDEILVASDTGEVLAIVVSTGGFLGMGEHQSLISPEDLRFNDDRTLIQADLTKELIQTAPNYKKGQTAGLDKVRPLGKNAAAWEKRSESGNLLSRDKGHGRGLAVAELMDMNVETRQNESVGEVEDVFLDLANRQVVGVVVSTGGFLGMGERSTLLGIDELSFDPKTENILLDYNRQQIGELPEYMENDQSLFDGVRTRVSSLDPRAKKDGASIDARTDARKDNASNLESMSGMTAFDQGNSSEEIDMTASIRRAIGENDTLSTRANNVTIITNKQMVLLRGEVDTAEEKTALEGIAHDKAGRENVSSQLTVAGL